mgnify:CR=1 FL=1
MQQRIKIASPRSNTNVLDALTLGRCEDMTWLIILSLTMLPGAYGHAVMVPGETLVLMTSLKDCLDAAAWVWNTAPKLNTEVIEIRCVE